MLVRVQFWPELSFAAVGMFFEQNRLQWPGSMIVSDLRVERQLVVARRQLLTEQVAGLLVVDRQVEAGVLQLLLQDLLGQLTALVAGRGLDREASRLAALGPDAVAVLRPAGTGHQLVDLVEVELVVRRTPRCRRTRPGSAG